MKSCYFWKDKISGRREGNALRPGTEALGWLTIRRRGGRKQIIGPDGAAVGACEAEGVAATRGDPALVKALARAFRWRRMLEEGRYASISEMAKAEGVERGYVGTLLRLTLLAPVVVSAILEGRQPQDCALSELLQSVPPSWPDQVSRFTAHGGRPI